MKSIKIALTGPNGQLGSELCRYAPPDVELVPLARGKLDITVAGQAESIITGLRPDFIINTAAYVRVDDAEDEANTAFSVNAVGARNLAICAEKTGAVLIHISTDYVFDGGKKPVPYNEYDLPNPLNTYGISKYAGEFYIKNLAPRHYILRVASLYGAAGASGKGKKGNFVYTVLDKARRGEPMKIVDDIFMSPTYAADAAREIWKLVTAKENEVKPFGVYHAANSGFCSWYEFAMSILKHGGLLPADISPVSHTGYKTRARRPLWSALESSKGIKLRPWEEGLRDFIASISSG